jgi:ABC-type transport system substrate-binding protein
MVRNPHYWGKGPYFDKVVLGIIQNQATEIDGMLSGERTSCRTASCRPRTSGS